jgi:hypothetical protein
MAVDIDGGIISDGELARLALMPEVRDAAQTGAELIGLWPLQTGQQLANDAKYAEDLQVRVGRSAAQVLTGEDIAMADAEFVYEGAVDIPGRSQSVVDALLDVYDAYEQMEGYSSTGDTSLVMAGSGDLHVDWDKRTVEAVAQGLEQIEATVLSGSLTGSKRDGSEERPSEADVESVTQRLAVVLAAVGALFEVIDTVGGFDKLSVRDAAHNFIPVMLYANELCERIAIPRVYLSSHQFEDALDKHRQHSGGNSADALAAFVAPIVKAEWEKHRNDVMFDPVAVKQAEKEKEEKLKKAKLAEKFKDVPEDKDKPPVEL